MRYELNPLSPALSLITPEGFLNRQIIRTESGLLFDGYSMYAQGEGIPELEEEQFTLSLCFFPATFSAHGDGLFSYFDERTQRGLEVILNKGGRVHVHFGSGRFCAEFSSCNAHVRPGMVNIVTIVFRGDCGWCDLYVNGAFSNRRQFSRHTALSMPKGPFYLGKRVDGFRFTGETMPFGLYYGFLQWLQIDGFAWKEADILALHREWYTGEEQPEVLAAAMPRREAYKDDPHRPRYHLCPPGKWMNEPHGPMFYDGWYHIFYQANPHAPIWDHLSWGHLYSRDMVRWQDAPLALTPEGGAIAPDGCWSGSSLVDKEGVPRIYFTGGSDREFPNQFVALATPEPGCDGRLLRWKQSAAHIQTQNIGWMGEFRDPFVWLETGEYFMLVGTGDEENGGGNAALYSSSDGIGWTCHGMLVDYDFSINPEVGHVWELPVLLPLKDEMGTIVCHALLLCACQIEGDIVETYYFLGHWDPHTRHFEKMHEKARLVDLGRGTFTGPSGFVTPDGRSVLFTIAQGHRGFQAELHAGWAHNGGLPVELFWKNGDLGVRPIREIASLKKAVLLDLESVETDAINVPLAEKPGNRLALELTARGDTASIHLCGGEEPLTVRYDRSRRHLGVWNAAGEEIGRWRGPEDDVDIGGEPIRFTCYLDHSMLELYLNDTKSVTLRNYFPDSRFFQVQGDIDRLPLWEMDAAYPQAD